MRLFDYEPYNGMPGFAKDSDTSQAAAISIVDSAATWRERIISIFATNHSCGLTADEVAAAFGHPNTYTVFPRITELYLAGKIAKTKSTRPTRRGRAAVVYTFIESHRSTQGVGK